ncbi:MAG: bifunctional 4-hydroxy-2-oxoglutarate aldolase/2-dehydro-3-deoxy-phosphogluconate aldolase [Nitrospinales bacterium]
MPSDGFNQTRFEEEPVLGIIRGVTRESLQGVLEAAITGGLRFVEITLNTQNAPELIEQAVRDYSRSLCIGAGTVLCRQDAQTALASGARFIVTPTLNDDVAAFCRDQDLAFFPGAFTPTEIEKAWRARAAMVKVFPASQLGPEYFRDIKGPFPEIRLMAVGGVGPHNIGDYLAAGASALAVGGSVFSPERMTNRKFDLIRADIEDFLLAVRNFYSKMS